MIKMKIKRIIYYTCLLIFMCSCNKDNDVINCTQEEFDTDNYYIKYTISSTYPIVFSNWSVSTPNGNYSKNGYQTRSWEDIYGPVKKGFICSVNVERGTATTKIYISKNNEPFSLKSTGNNSTSYQIR